jgi:hypothetical protein
MKAAAREKDRVQAMGITGPLLDYVVELHPFGTWKGVPPETTKVIKERGEQDQWVVVRSYYTEPGKKEKVRIGDTPLHFNAPEALLDYFQKKGYFHAKGGRGESTVVKLDKPHGKKVMFYKMRTPAIVD